MCEESLYRGSLEELVEAKCFCHYLETGQLLTYQELSSAVGVYSVEDYIGGVCDFTGFKRTQEWIINQDRARFCPRRSLRVRVDIAGVVSRVCPESNFATGALFEAKAFPLQTCFR